VAHWALAWEITPAKAHINKIPTRIFDREGNEYSQDLRKFTLTFTQSTLTQTENKQILGKGKNGKKGKRGSFIQFAAMQKAKRSNCPWVN
jgi:hypothetical protein